MRATDILRQLAHAEGFEAQVVARSVLRQRAMVSTEERAAFIAKVKARPRSLRLAAPGIWVIPNPLAQLVYQGMNGWDAPRPVDVAVALEHQHGWTIGMPRDVALYVLGMGERPLSPAVLPYDQSERREYPCGLVLEPADPALVRRNPVAQIVLQALAGKDLSAEGLVRLAETAAAGAVIATPSMRQELAECLSHGELYGAAETFAQALLAVGEIGYATKAPVDWQPPAEPDAEVRVDGWRVREIEDRSGQYFALVASAIRNHPYIGNGDSLSRSSPILWLDEQQGWCRTQSRLYRLGLTVEQRREEERRQAEEERQQTLAAIREIRAVAEGFPVEICSGIDWDQFELTAGNCICDPLVLCNMLNVVLEHGLSKAGTAVATELLERVSWALNSKLDLDF